MVGTAAPAVGTAATAVETAEVVAATSAAAAAAAAASVALYSDPRRSSSVCVIYCDLVRCVHAICMHTHAHTHITPIDGCRSVNLYCCAFLRLQS